jgi:hypothetical protein
MQPDAGAPTLTKRKPFPKLQACNGVTLPGRAAIDIQSIQALGRRLAA